MLFKVSCLVLMVFGVAQTAVLPVEKCKLSDSPCLTKAFQKMMPIFMAGIPESNVEVLDPMQLDDLTLDVAGLHFTLKGGVMKGLKNSVVDNVEWDTEKKVITVLYHLDNTVKGHYTADGQVLILPITGDGEFKLKLEHLEIKLHIFYEMVKGADGKSHIKPKKFDFDYDVKKNAHYYLSNLFNGNKELSEGMLNFLNQNWKQISNEFGRPTMQVAATKVIKNIGNFCAVMPIEDIAIL